MRTITPVPGPTTGASSRRDAAVLVEGRADQLRPWLDALGTALAEEGPERHEESLGRLARFAGSHGAHAVLCEVLTDRSAPAVLRLRAFAKLAVALTAAPPRPAPRPARAA